MGPLGRKRVVVVGGAAAVVAAAVGALQDAGAAVELVTPPSHGDVGGDVERAAAQLGGLDVLANLAAADRSATAAAEVSREHWDRELKATLRATRTSNQAAFRLMTAAGGGHVVNLADQRALGMRGAALASATAQAIVALTNATAGAWAAAGVRVNLLQPSVRADPVETVAPTLVFLCGDAPLHGQTITC